jgi:CheY-like chemotaxis protein
MTHSHEAIDLTPGDVLHAIGGGLHGTRGGKGHAIPRPSGLRGWKDAFIPKVLVVEDDPDGAAVLRSLLELGGCNVQVAHTGGAGVALARKGHPDTVVCDIGLADLDGFGVARALREDPTTAGTRLIALTGYGDEGTRRRAEESGFDFFLTKPADPGDLLRLVSAPAGGPPPA